MHLETERSVARFRRWIGLPADVPVHYAHLPLQHCVFPESGRYHAIIRFDGQELARYPFDVFLEESTHG